MDGQTLRQRLREATTEYSDLEARREALANIIKGYEQLIRLDGTPELPQAQPEAQTLPLPIDGSAKGTVSFRSAVIRVLKDAHGEPLHIKEIYQRAVALGAVSGAKEPVRVTDLLIYSLIKRSQMPIDKTAPATYRWAGGDDDVPKRP